VASAIFASAAGAAEYPITALPQLGRCVKVKSHTGEWLEGHCQGRVRHGNDNWLEGPGAKPKFIGAGGVVVLVTSNSAHQIECAASQEEGEYVHSKLQALKWTLIGCSRPMGVTKQHCQNFPPPLPPESNAGEIAFEKATGELGMITHRTPPKKSVDGWEIKGLKATVHCGEPPELNILVDEIEGSVVAPVAVLSNMVTEETLTYKSNGTKQVPEKFEGEPAAALTSKFTDLETLTTSTEAVGVVGEVVTESEEPLEIKAQCVEGPKPTSPECK
jgi:hypothetical protein